MIDQPLRRTNHLPSRRQLRRRSLAVLLISGIAIAVLILVVVVRGVTHAGGLENIQRIYSNSLAGFGETTLALLFHQTKYSPDFDEAAFWTIKKGDSEASVIGKLGEPLSTTELRIASGEVHTRTWEYADRANRSASWYLERSVIFNERGEVAGKAAFLATPDGVLR